MTEPAAEEHRQSGALLAGVVVVGVVLDQATKAYFTWLLGTAPAAAGEFLREYFSAVSLPPEAFPFKPFHRVIPVLGEWFQFKLALNTGAAWSILQGNPRLLALISLILIALLYFYWRMTGRSRPLMGWGLMLMIAGATGNFLDRLRMGVVVDFLDVHIPVPGGQPYDFPVFNVADSLASIGVMMVIVATFFLRPRRKDAESAKDAPTPEQY